FGSRAGPHLPRAPPESAEAVAALGDVVVDGELVIWGDGGLDFPALLQRMAAKGTRRARPGRSQGGAASPSGVVRRDGRSGGVGSRAIDVAAVTEHDLV